jgi:hypothetical protein
VTGSGPPPIGGNTRLRHHEPRERSWNWYPGQAWNRLSSGYRGRRQQEPRRCQWVQRRYPPALKEEEAGILQFEVRSASPRAPSILRDTC